MRCLGIMILSLVVVLSPASGALAVLDQSYEPDALPDLLAIVNNQFTSAQVFTPGLSGALTGVEITLGRNAQAPEAQVVDLIIEIQGVTSGVPDNSVLGSVTIPKGDVPFITGNPDFFAIDLSSLGISATVGVPLAIVARSPGSFAQSPYEWSGDTGNPYAGGDRAFRSFDDPFTTVSSQDLGFRTFVPEPGVGLLMGAGIAMLAARRCRQILTGSGKVGSEHGRPDGSLRRLEGAHCPGGCRAGKVGLARRYARDLIKCRT